MQLTLRPANAYAIASLVRPGQLKLGRSNIPGRRKSELHGGDPSVYIAETFAFLDAEAAEDAAQKHFADRWVDGEWFRVNLCEITAFYRKLQDAELPQIRKAQKAVAFIQNHNNSALCRSVEVAAEELSLLLNREIAGTGLTVSEAIRAAMTGSNTLKVVTALQKAGVLLQKAEKVALLDRTRGGPLERFYAKTPFANTWRKYFSKIAGFSADGKCVKMSSWKKNTISSQDILDKVCAL